MTIPMENNKESSSRELAQRLFNKNVELGDKRRKAAQLRIPSDPNTWQQMRENYEAIILEDHAFSEQHDIEYALWQLHYRRIEELRALFNAAVASAGSAASQNGKGLYGEGDSKARDFAAASSYYMQASSLCPSNGNPHHQLAILAGYSNDELVSIYRYFRSLAVDNPFVTARDNLIIAFEKNRQNYTQLIGDGKATQLRPHFKDVWKRKRQRWNKSGWPVVLMLQLAANWKRNKKGSCQHCSDRPGGIYFDTKLKKFVVGAEPQISDDYLLSSPLEPNLNVNIENISAGVEMALGHEPNSEVGVEAEEEDEVIVFRPFINEKHMDEFSSNLNSKVLPSVSGAGNTDIGKENGSFSVGHDSFLFENALNASMRQPATVANVTLSFCCQSNPACQIGQWNRVQL
ncbi:UNVERIFIED_CONTAM: protein SMG7 [Sesamum radiatum]|uniref:Protein SMG7 n=1 Tax=Sesamum radiatum TaxID=300843 RepID=A0AAW2TME0_SESRA